jgi:hypothetical protein
MDGAISMECLSLISMLCNDALLPSYFNGCSLSILGFLFSLDRCGAPVSCCFQIFLLFLLF